METEGCPHLWSSRSFLAIRPLKSSSRHCTCALASGACEMASGEQMPSSPRSCRMVLRASSCPLLCVSSGVQGCG